MKPYYQDDSVAIYHGDCRDLVDVWDVSDGVMVTDPPYGMGFVAGKRNSRVEGWTSRWTGVEIAGDDSVGLRDGILGLWAPRPALVFATWKRPWPTDTQEVLIWDKVVSTGMGDLSIPWRPSWEAICVLGGGFIGPRSHGVLAYSLPTLSPDRQHHPTVKPLELMRHLIGKCPENAIVIDPFMGSGTILRAAKDLGRRAIGIEVDEKYCAAAVKRLAQGSLFEVG